jgi:hypothetical protein
VRAALPSIAGLPSSSDLNYTTSKLIYRISYPRWGGVSIKHDPTYVGYFVPTLSTQIPPGCCPAIIIYPAVALAGVAAITVFLVIKRTRKIRKQYQKGTGSEPSQ